MKKLLLIPSARLIAKELQIEFGAIPTALIPLNNQPALKYISQPYLEIGYEVVVAVSQGAEKIEHYLEHHPEFNGRAVNVGHTDSIGETVINVLDALGVMPEQVVINFADTYLEEPLTHKNTICYVLQDDVFRWTSFEIDDQERICNVIDKGHEKPKGDIPVIVGLFSIADVPIFLADLKQAVRSEERHSLDTFYIAIREYMNRLSGDERSLLEIKDWRDFGHLDTYHATKKKFFLNKRFFNRIRIDAERGIIHKSSSHTQDLIDEITWYLKLPKGLQYLAPRVFEYDLDFTKPWAKMEFYGYPALNDVYLFGDCNMGVWNQILLALDRVLKDMTSYALQPDDGQDLVEAMREMYDAKTRSRLASVLEDDAFAPFSREEVTINGRPCVGLNAIIDMLPEVADKIDLYSQNTFTIIHGDLCLSNILYDQRNRIVRLVDPRGRFGMYDIYGDPRYDLAKLTHSFEGDYDFLANDLFDLKWDAGQLEYRPHLENHHRRVKALFHDRIITRLGVKAYHEIKFIESLLFLSMVPLHVDRPRSQQALLARGLETFTTVLENLRSR